MMSQEVMLPKREKMISRSSSVVTCRYGNSCVVRNPVR